MKYEPQINGGDNAVQLNVSNTKYEILTYRTYDK